jgi:hypothetical protein
MCAYHFHCTNGGAIVADLRGAELHDVVAVRDHAAGTARDVLEIYPQSNPSDWLVTVQDCAGYQVAVLTFPELLRGRAFT